MENLIHNWIDEACMDLTIMRLDLKGYSSDYIWNRWIRSNN